jgi:hypothetical protein
MIHEDSPPLARPRVYKDVIDRANALCMEIRAKRQREEFAKSIRRTLRALPYQVHFGTHHCHTQHFSTFPLALEFLSDHVDDEFMPALVGASFDGERTGLTEDERELAAAVLDTRKPRNVRG